MITRPEGVVEGWDAADALAEEAVGDAELVILDNLSCLFPSVKENEADGWAPIQTWLLSLRRESVSVLFVHHSGR